MTLEVPALRERKLDIEALLIHFIDSCCKKNKVSKKTLHPVTLRVLQGYSWPGNIRELQNVVEQMVVFTDASELLVEHLPIAIKTEVKHLIPKPKKIEEKPPTQKSVVPIQAENLSIKKRTEILEIELIKKALGVTAGNRTHAAKILEISHRALLYKLKEYGIE